MTNACPRCGAVIGSRASVSDGRQAQTRCDACGWLQVVSVAVTPERKIPLRPDNREAEIRERQAHRIMVEEAAAWLERDGKPLTLRGVLDAIRSDRRFYLAAAIEAAEKVLMERTKLKWRPRRSRS